MANSTRSILRYPGSKARFCGFISRAMAMNTGRPRLFAEPFCGGASVSLALLEDGVVDEVAINDVDPLIANFWAAVFSPDDAAWLSSQALCVPLSLEEWRRQKALSPTTRREWALKCLYLNRTSFNGILHKAGPLGGWGQKNTDIGARFNRKKISDRIVELSGLRDRVSVSNEPWMAFCQRMAERSDSMLYLDPPYFHKAEQLYGYVFDQAAHVELRDFLRDLRRPWLLSYDDAADIRQLYGGMGLNARVIDNTYSTHPLGGASFVGRELVYTNMKKLPAACKSGAGHVGLSVRSVGRSMAPIGSPLRFPTSKGADGAGLDT